MRYLWIALLASPAAAQNTAGWGNTAAPEPEGFSWTDPLWAPFWMAWTPATLALFVGIFAAIALIGTAEAVKFRDGLARKGVLGLTTTLGDRLFLTLLGTAYIFLMWLAFFGQPVWGALGLSMVWAVFCFWKV